MIKNIAWQAKKGEIDSAMIEKSDEQNMTS